MQDLTYYYAFLSLSWYKLHKFFPIYNVSCSYSLNLIQGLDTFEQRQRCGFFGNSAFLAYVA